jgi:hypothetical protein
LAGIQYLDALFSAIRDTAEGIAAADGWISRADRAAGSNWQLPFLNAAHEAHLAAHKRLEEAFAQLEELGPADRLPSLLSDLPDRLDQLRADLEASEARLSTATDAALTHPIGRA